MLANGYLAARLIDVHKIIKEFKKKLYIIRTLRVSRLIRLFSLTLLRRSYILFLFRTAAQHHFAFYIYRTIR